MTDSKPLASAFAVGNFLLAHYERDGEIKIPEFLADLLDLCRRFDVDFDAALEDAQERVGPQEPFGTGSKNWNVTIAHEVTFTRTLWVKADTAVAAEELALSEFRPRWGDAELTDVVVHEVAEDE
ncbi:MAG: hypothetical protein K2X87_19280 [Gemmataceae bacterium]|nr:hypothetical protein [Gemmataceae bacterium]